MKPQETYIIKAEDVDPTELLPDLLTFLAKLTNLENSFDMKAVSATLITKAIIKGYVHILVKNKLLPPEVFEHLDGLQIMEKRDCDDCPSQSNCDDASSPSEFLH